ncbi:RDD family protein [Pseudoxanthomonas wuyuanensis]
MNEWYYVDAAQQRQGPIDAPGLAALHRSGQIADDTLVWRDGMDQWQPLAGRAIELELETAPATAVVAPAAALSTAETETAGDNTAEERPLTGRAVFTAHEPRQGQYVPPQLEPALTAGTAYGGGSAVDAPYAPPQAPVNTGTRVVTGGEVVYAGFWKRVAASLIDGVVVGIGGSILSFIVMALLGLGMSVSFADIAMGTAPIVLQLANYAVSMAVAVAYFAGFHASRSQATLGKMAVGIKVVRSNGEPISLARGVGRYFGYLLSYLLLLIGYLMAAFTERKQALHDFICDTLVVDKWAYTDHPEWQRRELGVVTIVVLVLGGLLLLGLIVMMIAVFGILFASFR